MKRNVKGHISPSVNFAVKHLEGTKDQAYAVEQVRRQLEERFSLKEVGSTAKRTRTRTSAHDIDFIVIFPKNKAGSAPKVLRDELHRRCLKLLPKLREIVKGSIIHVHLHSRTVKLEVQCQGKCVVFDMMPALKGENGEYQVPNENKEWKSQAKHIEISLLEEEAIKRAVLLGKVVKDSYFPSLLPSCAFEFAINEMKAEPKFNPV